MSDLLRGPGLYQRQAQALSLRADASRLSTVLLPFTLQQLFVRPNVTAPMPAAVEPFVHLAHTNSTELYKERIVQLSSIGALREGDPGSLDHSGGRQRSGASSARDLADDLTAARLEEGWEPSRAYDDDDVDIHDDHRTTPRGGASHSDGRTNDDPAAAAAAAAAKAAALSPAAELLEKVTFQIEEEGEVMVQLLAAAASTCFYQERASDAKLIIDYATGANAGCTSRFVDLVSNGGSNVDRAAALEETLRKCYANLDRASAAR